MLMKRLHLILITLLTLSVQYSFGKTPGYISERKLTFGPEKDKQIIEVARTICQKHAPDYDISNLTPVIVNFRLYRENSPLRPGEIVSVKFVTDSNNIDRRVVVDPREPNTVRLQHSLKAVIHAEVYVDNLEPAGVGVYYGSLFLPDYETFCKNQPNYIYKDYTPQEPKVNCPNLEELTKAEFEKKGNKVSFGKRAPDVKDIPVEEWERRGYKVIVE